MWSSVNLYSIKSQDILCERWSKAFFDAWLCTVFWALCGFWEMGFLPSIKGRLHGIVLNILFILFLKMAAPIAPSNSHTLTD